MHKTEPFKERLKKALELNKLRPVDLCNKTGISQATISQYLSGYSKPKEERLTLLANTLDVDPSWLLGLDVPEKKDAYSTYVDSNSIGFEITARSLACSPEIFEALCNSVQNALSLADLSKYRKPDGSPVPSPYEILKDPQTPFEKKAELLKTMIDFAIYDIQKDQLDIFYSSEDINSPKTETKSEEEKLLETIIHNCQQINLAGLRKIHDYLIDISSLEQYKSK